MWENYQRVIVKVEVSTLGTKIRYIGTGLADFRTYKKLFKRSVFQLFNRNKNVDKVLNEGQIYNDG
jgi:hypothetical protein